MERYLKNIIIAGVSRAGKSTLAKNIAKKFNITYIPFDCIVSTLGNLFPSVGITHCDDNKLMSKNIAIFLEEYIKHLSYEDISYVIDLYQIYPEDLSNILDLSKHTFVYLGYSKLSSQEKMINIKKYARDKDWTKKTSDNDLKKILSLFIAESKLMQEECEKINCKFFDTGKNFDKTINEAEEYISEHI